MPVWGPQSAIDGGEKDREYHRHANRGRFHAYALGCETPVLGHVSQTNLHSLSPHLVAYLNGRVSSYLVVGAYHVFSRRRNYVEGKVGYNRREGRTPRVTF